MPRTSRIRSTCRACGRRVAVLPDLRPRRPAHPEEPRAARPAGERARAPHRLGHRHRARSPSGSPTRSTRPLIMQIYSRLVIDCNRDPLVPSSICEISEIDRRPRQHEPSTRRTGAPVRARSSRPTTSGIAPSWTGGARSGPADGARLDAQLHAGLQRLSSRPWHVGRALQPRPALRPASCSTCCVGEGDLVVGDNEPYFVERPDRLHDPRAWRATRPAACRDRDPPGPDRRGGGPARLGGPAHPAPAARRYESPERERLRG